METTLVEVPASQAEALPPRWTNYKSALESGNTAVITAARLLLQNTLNKCSTALGRPTAKPGGWPYPIYPNVVEDGDALMLEYPAV
jgi:hypothetical protein